MPDEYKPEYFAFLCHGIGLCLQPWTIDLSVVGNLRYQDKNKLNLFWTLILA